MPEIVAIRFKRAGKVYYFDPGNIDVKVGDWVIVETSKGQEAGKVVIGRHQVEENTLTEPLKPVLRIASSEDIRKMEMYKSKEQEALQKCREKILQHNLPMKLVGADYSFDGSKIVFFFTAESRVDFRELVKDLAATFKTRIELRQIGVRDEAKFLGGLGRCGQTLCCASFLKEFEPVSIKMAKDQDLPLNPMKISGLCGRLLCCLAYENEFYCQAKQNLPSIGSIIETNFGQAKVIGVNVIKNTINVELESGVTTEIPANKVDEVIEEDDLSKNSNSYRKRRKI